MLYSADPQLAARVFAPCLQFKPVARTCCFASLVFLLVFWLCPSPQPQAANHVDAFGIEGHQTGNSLAGRQPKGAII